MKIIQANKFYYRRGGADVYAIELSELLREAGHEVIPFAMKHKENLETAYEKYFVSEVDLKKREGFFSDLKKIGRIVYSLEARKKFKKLLRDEKPDVVHVHNIYHQISPSILSVARRAKVPVVMTVHDYKLINPNYSMFHYGSDVKANEVCEHGKDGKYWQAVWYNCMNSYGASLTIAVEAYIHSWLKIYKKGVKRFISPSKFLIDLFSKRGYARRKFVNIPNFVRPIVPPKKSGSQCVLYFGRLSEEKGLFTLIEAAKMIKPMPVKIVGKGPQEKDLKRYAEEIGASNVQFVGYKSGNALWSLVAGARAVVMPSISYDNYPLAVLEAQSMGKIVIATDKGGLPEMVQDGETGFLFPPKDSLRLAKIIEHVWNMPISERGAMEGAARERVMRENNPEDHVKRVVALYKSLV